MQGLTTEEVKDRRSRYGYNEVPEKKESAILLFLGKFWGVTPWMLEITIVLTIILGKYFDTAMVAFLLVFNSVLGFMQESRATSALDFLMDQLTITTRVRRDGTWSALPARELVPGDVIRLRAGDFVPADVRMEEGYADVDQSSLTGESFIVGKAAGDTLYSGTVVRRGEATGRVTATGMDTYFGRTVRLVRIARPRLRLEAVTASVVRWLLLFIVALLLIGLAVTWLRGGDIVELLPLAVILLISAIPVALPTIFIISSALGSLDLAKRGALTTRLNAIENAAGMDVLCADKTGTITLNRLSVTAALPAGRFSEEDVLRYGALASREENRDPIDLALLAAAKERSIGLAGYRQERFIPFDPSTRRTEALISDDGRQWRICKGALSAILPLCLDGVADLADAEGRAGKPLEGGKALAVAVGIEGQPLKLAGTIYLEDPPRPDSPALVRRLRDLGISVKMLTGDAAPIARRIAGEVGLGPNVMDFSTIKKEAQSGRALKDIEEADGFAEIYPEDKFLIVESLQKGGHVVGMTGDGVNDTPALKQADVGIAVGGAADVARRAASVVLTVEGLDAIVDLVLIGRRTYRRISTWIFNKIVKTFQVIIFLILAFMLTGQSMISIFCIILYYFLSDFVTLTLATDNASPSPKPEKWDISGLVRASIPLGLLLVIESFFLIFGAMYLFGIHGAMQVYTLTFDVLMFFSLLDVLIVRERGHFWESKPGNLLLLAIAGDILVVALISIFGLPGLASISAAAVLTVLACIIIATFTVNDLIKVVLVRWLWKE